MLDPTKHPGIVRLLGLFERCRARLRRPAHDGVAADSNLREFYWQIWHAAAAAVGADIECIGGEILQVRRGRFSACVLQNTTPADDLMTHLLVRTKPVVARLLQSHGIRTAASLAFDPSELKPALEFLCRHRVCVIKPAGGTGGGAGVTTGIRSPWALARAACASSRHGGQVLIEQQVAGFNYRLLYLDGELIDAVRRDPPAVVGDGRSSVLELVRAANQSRARGGPAVSHTLLTIDLDMRHTLSAQGLGLRSRPPAGATVVLKTAINENAAADNVPAAAELCPSIVRDGAAAARACGVRLAGVDVITPDPTVPLAQSGGVVLEVNSPPGYYWHYCRRGPGVPVAEHVLRRLLSDRSSHSASHEPIHIQGALLDPIPSYTVLPTVN